MDMWEHTEYNCGLYGCTVGNSRCDTQLFTTFYGRDVEGRTCLSDDYRISSYVDFGDDSYQSSANFLTQVTYPDYMAWRNSTFADQLAPTTENNSSDDGTDSSA